MFYKSIFAAVTILTVAGQAFGVPSNAPFDSCILLSPKNGQQPPLPAKTSPFKITAEKTMDSKDQHEAVRVTISSDKMEKFSGFIVQARYANNPSLLVDGRFVPEDLQVSKTYTCKPGEKIINNGQNNKDGGSVMEGRSAAQKMDKISDDYKHGKPGMNDRQDGGDEHSKGYSDGYGDEKGLKGSAGTLVTSFAAMIVSLAMVTLF